MPDPVPARTRTPPRVAYNNNVLFVGMNPTAKLEVEALRSRGVAVTLVTDSLLDDRVTVTRSGRTGTFDLTQSAEIDGFAFTLGLPPEQTKQVAAAIASLGADARDEAAALAQVWAQAERGVPVPSRLVLSGHSVGSGPWGDNNGKFHLDSLALLAAAMPRAARSVEDLQLAACYSGSESLMQRYQAIFPALKTVWAYVGSAPGAASGSTTHLLRWEYSTRGGTTLLRRSVADKSRKGENVAVWSRALGYQDGATPVPIDSLRTEFSSGEPLFLRHLSGEDAVDNPQSGPLRDYYNTLQQLLRHAQLAASESAGLEARRDQTIRLIYYSATVAPRFAAFHAGAIREGFLSLGLGAPDFGRLSRAEALAQVARFEERLAATSPVPAAAARLRPALTNGLRDLSNSAIPEGWI